MWFLAASAVILWAAPPRSAAVATALRLRGPATDTVTSMFLDEEEVITRKQILFATSPKEGKVTYADLVNFKARANRVFPLIDSGLRAPTGIAVDKSRSMLYVTDPDAQKIYVYNFHVDVSKEGNVEVTTRGSRYTILQSLRSRWVAVDAEGDLFYTNEDEGQVCTLKFVVIKKLINGELTPEALKTTTKDALEAKADAAASKGQKEGELAMKSLWQTDSIFVLYQKGGNNNVTTPSGIYADGINIFWGNLANGKEKGAVVVGQAKPGVVEGASSYSSLKLASNTNEVWGVVKTRTSLIFTDTSNKVYIVNLSGGEVKTLCDMFDNPRGVVWDGDNTIYVADNAAGKIWSLPSGRLHDNVPTSHVVDLHDAFGLAILSESDPAFRGGASTFSLALASVLTIAALWRAVVA